MKIPKEKYARMVRDFNEMWNAHQTIFIRCKCGHIKEQGLICPNEKCKED